MGDTQGYEIGQKLELADGRVGVVQFVGTTSFADGAWIGLVLDDWSGKNDGAVQGKRYFRCEPGKGMFVRPAGVASILEQPAAKTTKRQSLAAPSNLASKTRSLARPSNAAATTKRQSLVDPTAQKRAQANASPTPAARTGTRTQTVRTPSKSPTKQLGARPSSGASSQRAGPNSTAAKPTASTRSSIGGRLAPSKTSSRTSMGGASTNGLSRGQPSTTRKPAGRLSTLQQSSRSGSVSSTNRSDQLSPTSSQDAGAPSSTNEDEGDNRTEDEDRTVQSPTQADHTPKPQKFGSSKPSEDYPATVAQRTTPASSALSRENEVLKTKLKHLEKQGTEHREKLKALEKVQEERDKYKGIIEKLQKKYQPQQQEIADLRKQVKDFEAQANSKSNGMDIDTAVEIATLDREMAEETAEACRQELEILRQEHDELKLEVEILREENVEYSKEVSPEERTSQGWMQLERTNERLREALMRLRDMTQDTEAELKGHIQELEEDVKELTSFKDGYEELKVKHDEAESVVEDLRAQLETAGGADDMIEELTENNMALQEQIDELKNAIEELENLKELNDELELNHVENEKQMQEEIDYQEALFLEHQRLSAQKDETIEELEYTTSRFRELVMNLQADLEDMRASQQITEIEANELSNKSRAMMDLNLKLQASANKTQVKAIEVEMGKLGAQESKDHLSIVQYFLPQTYSLHKDSVEAFLRVKRIGFKSNLLHGFVKERANGVAIPGHEDEVFMACDAFDKLTWVSAMCDRLSAFVQRCTLECFKNFATAMYDLEPVERALDGWIDGLKRDDFKDRHCANGLSRSIALMTHLAEAQLTEGLEEFADEVHMRALIMQSHLDGSASVIAQIRAMTQVKLILPTDADEEDEAEAEAFLAKGESLVSQLRSAKVVAGKAVHQVSDLKSRSLTLSPSTSDQIEQFQTSLREYAAACQRASSAFLAVVNEEGREDSLTYGEVTRALGASDATAFYTLINQLRGVMDQVQAWQSLTATLSQTVEFNGPSPSPWKLLSDQAKADVSASAEQDREISRLKEEVAARNGTISMKDKALEELNVNVEVLNKRVTESQGRREQLRELEDQLEARNRQEKDIAEQLMRAQEELRNLEAERENWTKYAPVADTSAVDGVAGTMRITSPTSRAPHVDGVTTVNQLDTTILKEEIQTLQATIRHLRQSVYHTTLSKENYSFLSNNLYPKQDLSHNSRLQFSSEVKDAFTSLLELSVSDSGSVPEISLRDKTQRLNWRPVKETVRWKVRQQTEDWAAWCEWRDDLFRRQRESLSGQAPNREPQKSKAGSKDVPLARLGVTLPGKVWEEATREVKIVRPEEWGEIERGFGLA